MNLKSVKLFCALFLLTLLPNSAHANTAVPLMTAIEESAKKISEQLPKGSRVAIVAWESEHDNLSDYLMEELTGALVDRGMEVADRQNLEYVYKELELQQKISDAMGDSAAAEVGKFVAAEMTIKGELIDIGGAYRYRVHATHAEKGIRASNTALNVQGSAEMRRMVTALVNRTTKAGSKYGVSANKTPQTAGTFLDRGIMFASQRNYNAAIADFTEALKLNPNLARAYFLRGTALAVSVSTVVSMDENFSNIITRQTITYVGVENVTAAQREILDRAISDFTQAARLEPDNVDAYLGRGSAHLSGGGYDAALADYDKAIRTGPNNAGAYFSRGFAYFKKGDYDAAIADFNRAIQINANFAEAYLNRGISYLQKHNYDAALADYNRVIQMKPNDAEAYVNRGLVYQNKNDYDRAIADYNRAIQINPSYAEAYANRGLAYGLKNDNNRAAADFEAALRIDPSITTAKQGLEFIRQKSGGVTQPSRSSGEVTPITVAIEQSAKKFLEELPKGCRVAVVAFESEHDNVSDYIMDELAAALSAQGIEVADRRNLEFAFQELDLKLKISNAVDDSAASKVGKILAANAVITGELIGIGGSYRYRTSAILVEKGIRASVTRLDIAKDAETRRMVTGLINRQARSTLTADKTPQSAGAFFDRGLMFYSQKNYEKAIADFNEALKLNPNLARAYHFRGMATSLVASRAAYMGFHAIHTISIYKATAEQKQVFDRAIADLTQSIRLDPNFFNVYNDRGFLYNNKGEYDLAIADFNRALQMNPNYSVMYMNRGVAYIRKHDFDRALADFNRAMQLNPGDVWAYVNRGSVYFMKNDPNAAIADCNRAIQMDPNIKEAYNNRGGAYREKGDYVAALADFNRAIQIDHKYADAYCGRGKTHQEKGDHAAAIADYNKAIEVNPQFAFAYQQRGEAYHDKGDYAAAVADFTKSLEIIPDDIFVHFKRGHSYRNKGDLDQALADYNAALRLDPNSGSAYNFRGNVHTRKGNHDAAIADYNNAIRIVPDYTTAYVNRGIAYMGKGDIDKGIADFDAAIRIDQNDAIAYYHRGDAYGRKNDLDRALADFNRAIQINPNHADAYYYRGNVHSARNDNDLAIADFDRAIQIKPQTSVYMARGNAHARKNDFDRALADYEKAMQIDPSYIGAYHWRGIVYRNRGIARESKDDYDRSIADFSRLIQYNQKDAVAYVNRGLTYGVMGDFDRAIADFEAALRIDPNNADAKQMLEIGREERAKQRHGSKQ